MRTIQTALNLQGRALDSIMLCFGRLQLARGWELSGFAAPWAMGQGGMGNYQTPTLVQRTKP